MKNIHAWGWLTAGVLALGLNGIYRDGGSAWAHRAVDPLIDRLEARIEPALAMTTGRAETLLGNIQSRALFGTRFGARFAGSSSEAASSRIAAAFARVQANRERMEARVRLTPVAMVIDDGSGLLCPRTRVVTPKIAVPEISIPQVTMPRVPRVRVHAPEVNVLISGTGPV